LAGGVYKKERTPRNLLEVKQRGRGIETYQSSRQLEDLLVL